MIEHTLHYSLLIPMPRPSVFAFFADAANLERITPPELRFAIVSPLPLVLGTDTEIDYRLQLFGIPFNWKTRITDWKPVDYFVDEQLAGPYALWIHRHTFRDGPDFSTIIDDYVRYRLPLSPWGELAYPLVRLQLARIFTFRQAAVRALLVRSPCD